MQGFFSSSTVQQDRPASGLVPKCGACGLYKHCTSPKMPPSGEGRKRVLVVGEFPGSTDDEEGSHFLGESGKYLRGVLEGIGVDLDRDAIATNAVICHPEGSVSPDALKINHCHPNLVRTLREEDPDVVVTLGRAPLVSVLTGIWKSDVDTLERWTGWTIPFKDFWICPTFHPSFLLRSDDVLLERQFKEHLETAFSLEGKPNQPTVPKIVTHFDDSQAWDVLGRMDEEGGWVAVDYEGNCLKPEYPKARISSIAYSNGRETHSFVWLGEVVEASKWFLTTSQTRKIASNLKFEERWTRKTFGRGVRNWGWDTMLAAHCLDNRQGICSLKFQAFVRLGVPTYNDRIEPYLKSDGDGHYNRVHLIALKDLLFYGGMDAYLEWKLARVQRKEMGYED